MVKNIQDLWIVTKGGQLLFKRVFDESVNSVLFSGFMSAINAFTSQMTKDHNSLSNFELGDKKFFISSTDALMFICNADPKVKSKHITKNLQEVVNLFSSAYSNEIIENWDGESSFFISFESQITNYIESPMDKMKNSFW